MCRRTSSPIRNSCSKEMLVRYLAYLLRPFHSRMRALKVEFLAIVASHGKASETRENVYNVGERLRGIRIFSMTERCAVEEGGNIHAQIAKRHCAPPNVPRMR